MYEVFSDVEQLVLKILRRALIEERSETACALAGRSPHRTDNTLVRATVLEILDSQSLYSNRNGRAANGPARRFRCSAASPIRCIACFTRLGSDEQSSFSPDFLRLNTGSQPFKVGPVVCDEHQSPLRRIRELFRIARAQHSLVSRRPNVVPVPSQDLGNLDRDILIQVKPGKEAGSVHDFMSSDDDALPSRNR